MGSNPVRGAKPRKRASVFRRSARGADTRRSGGGRRSRTRIPLVSTTCNVRGLNLGWDLFCYPLRGSNPLAIPIFQMKQKIPFSAVDMQSKWDYLLHLERGTPTAHEARSRAEAETVAEARLRTEAGTGTAAAYGAGPPAQSPITRSKIARTLETHPRPSSVRMLIYLCCSAKVIVPQPHSKPHC